MSNSNVRLITAYPVMTRSAMTALLPLKEYGDDGWFTCVKYINKCWGAFTVTRPPLDFEKQLYRLPLITPSINGRLQRVRITPQWLELLQRERLVQVNRPVNISSLYLTGLIATNGPIWTQLLHSEEETNLVGVNYKHVVVCSTNVGSVYYLNAKTRTLEASPIDSFCVSLNQLGAPLVVKHADFRRFFD